MSRNDVIKATRLSASAIVGILVAFLMLTLAGCENVLAEAVKAMQALATSPKVA